MLFDKKTFFLIFFFELFSLIRGFFGKDFTWFLTKIKFFGQKARKILTKKNPELKKKNLTKKIYVGQKPRKILTKKKSLIRENNSKKKLKKFFLSTYFFN